MSLVEQQISDGRMLKLINSFLKQGVLEGLKEWEPEQGTPQGALCEALHKAPYAKKVIMQSKLKNS
jgi:RNA-directed DNA polymerase